MRPAAISGANSRQNLVGRAKQVQNSPNPWLGSTLPTEVRLLSDAHSYQKNKRLIDVQQKCVGLGIRPLEPQRNLPGDRKHENSLEIGPVPGRKPTPKSPTKLRSNTIRVPPGEHGIHEIAPEPRIVRLLRLHRLALKVSDAH